MVSAKKIFLSLSHYKFMGDNDPRGVASLDPRGLIGRIYVGDHSAMLHTKYVSSRSHGFREEDFLKFFPSITLWEFTTPLGHGQFGHQGLDWQDLCRGPLNIATYKIYKL